MDDMESIPAKTIGSLDTTSPGTPLNAAWRKKAETPPSNPINTPTFRLRKTPIRDTLNELTAVQRLVEYFIVVSPKPRWSNEEQAADARPSKLPFSRLFRHRGQTSQADITVTESTSSEFSGTASETVANGSSAEFTNHADYNAKASNRTEGNIHMPQHRTDHTFAPQITARYPLQDYEDNPLNPMTIQFCFPSGDVVVPTKSYEMPRVHHFALTNERGRKVYGTCLTFLEDYAVNANNPFAKMTQEDEDSSATGVEISMLQKQETLYLPKVICILSTWPYLTAFREYLVQLYQLATASNMMVCPIERYIVNLCKEIPAPPPGAYEVQVSILNSTIRIWAPPAKLPIAYVALPYQILFECLDLDNILKLWSAMVLERKILLLSSQHSILGVCSEILCSLLFPFRWSHLYIPLLPRMLCPMLDAPMPYLCGVVRENWLHAQQYVAGDTVVVDLDRNSVVVGKLMPPIPSMPQRKISKLQTTLHETVGHVFWRARGLEREYRTMSTKKLNKRVVPTMTRDNQWQEKLSGLDHAFNLAYTPDSLNLLEDTLPEDEQNMWLAQEAFLRFFVALMKGYHRFLSIPDTNSTRSKPFKPSFDRIGFLASQKSEAAAFLTEFCLTQHFDDFLTRRMYSPGEPDLIFFDQSIKAKINRSKLKLRKSETPLLQSAKAHKDLQKIRAVEPSGEDLREYDYSSILRPYAYKVWPEVFDTNLFSTPRPLPKSIVAEFDRQVLLTEKLRATMFEEEDVDDSYMFYGVDFDPSLEVATFTVFLFVYCALVGREWQAYAKKRRHELETTKETEERRQELEDNNQDHEACADVPDKRDAVEGLISDLVCDTCPAEGLATLKHVLVYCEGGAQDLYSAVFKPTVDQVTTLQLQLSEAIGFGPTELGEALDEFDEAREVAAAQLDLAFDILKTMNMRGLSADSDAYLSLMEACGRCGDTHRALHLLQLMRYDGFTADSEVLACFVAAFVQDGESGVDIGSPHSARSSRSKKAHHDSDAYSSYLKRKLAAAETSIKATMSPNDPFNDIESGSIESSEISGLIEGAPQSSGAFQDWLTKYIGSLPGPMTHRRGRRRRKPTIDRSPNRAVTDMVQRQVALGESLLDFVFPNLSIDTTSDSCPQCSYLLTETDICTGWTPCSFNDYTTKCPKCCHRFVPQFVVSCSSPTFEGSQGKGTPLYCEFLNPWVLRRKLQNVVKGDGGVDRLLDPSWRSGTGIQATLFWNLMVHLRRCGLPFSFLLQASFNSRLVLPSLPSDM